MKKFSPTYGTFYPEDLDPVALPDDVIDVTDEEHLRATNLAAGESLVVTDGKLYVVGRSVRSSVPSVVTMRQARLALLQTGKLAQVNAAVANMPGAAGDAARIEWEFSSTVERNRPLVESLGVALGMTDAQLDDLFTLAATL